MYTDLKELIQPVTGIETVTFGDVYNNWNNSEIKYSALNVFAKGCEVSDGQITYSLILFVADRLLEDKSNETFIYDIAVLQLEAILDNLEAITGVRNYTFFTEKFTDVVAGAFVEIEVTIPYSKPCNNL